MSTPVVISGPSGTGKSTLIKKLFAEFPDKFGFSISHSTRKARPQEADGVDYHFTTIENFKDLISKDEFLEWAQFSGNYYGTSKKAVDQVAKEGKICLLDIDMQGVKAIKESNLKAKYLFVAPPSVDVLKQRLVGRGTETEESIQKRLDAATRELEFAETGIHDKIIVNHDLDKAYEEFKSFILESQ
ncbi:guanylate kinase [Yamadazyma tenuis]|uniref:Guanylate kinase n=1 Tax=Candida tenuis (strain ATCC 10573 / BCRC 21748 / CBS 615 / JCM 9827 / NBRC 10315 / NRRL Y-1498 / VKM Y-70) TaxID=590646 RepID=G3AZ00_CANTC|nr:guanylate kinase [Yamadazyma tenuis ATCC 10573]EGV65971.1 guanylate kinase [Yamadazyma tenuis ATCC 10573]WEJ95692.1 guanylate kinase [Yamadazyma tenuis]